MPSFINFILIFFYRDLVNLRQANYNLYQKLLNIYFNLILWLASNRLLQLFNYNGEIILLMIYFNQSIYKYLLTNNFKLSQTDDLIKHYLFNP